MAKVFLAANEVLPLAAGVDVFGRSGGTEGVQLQSGVRDVELDANIERVDLPRSATEVTIAVTTNGVVIRQDSTTLATAPSLNQQVDLRFTDGNVTLRQTGAQTFTLEGANGNTQEIAAGSPVTPSVTLGDDMSGTGGDQPTDDPGDSDEGGDDGGSSNDDPSDDGGDDEPTPDDPTGVDELPLLPENGGPSFVTSGNFDSDNIDISGLGEPGSPATVRGNGDADRFVFQGDDLTNVVIPDFTFGDQLAAGVEVASEQELQIINQNGQDGRVTLELGTHRVTLTNLDPADDGLIQDPETFLDVFGRRGATSLDEPFEFREEPERIPESNFDGIEDPFNARNDFFAFEIDSRNDFEIRGFSPDDALIEDDRTVEEVSVAQDDEPLGLDVFFTFEVREDRDLPPEERTAEIRLREIDDVPKEEIDSITSVAGFRDVFGADSLVF